MTAGALTQSPTGNKRPVGWSLDAVNFFVSDVRGAFGPFVNVYLVTQLHWSQGDVGLIMMVGGLFGLATQTPIGWAIDHTEYKRGALNLALIVLTGAGLVIFLVPRFWPVLVANAAIAMVGDIFVPAVAAITLGLYAHQFLPRRLGRSAAFEHAGNATVALLAAAVGYFLSQRAVFLLAPAFALLAVLSVLSIPSDAIDLDRARGLEGRHKKHERRHHSTKWRDLCRHKGLVVFAVSALLFQFANAPLLPFVGQKLAVAYPREGTAMLSACIIAAQLVMLVISLVAGRKADQWGRKPILLVGYGVLAVRAALYTFSNSGVWVIGVELLDGVSSGIFAMLLPLIVADMMRGTGRYNLAIGVVATAQGIGSSISIYIAGTIVDHAGYTPAFLTLAAVAGLAFLVLVVAMPETRPQEQAAERG
jgi:MFS family permease